jgi:hypothetical protein
MYYKFSLQKETSDIENNVFLEEQQSLKIRLTNNYK